MRKNSIKNTRINVEVQKELSALISRDIKDPRINPMTTVIHVEVAPDLKTAKVYISVLGDEDSRKSTLAGLKSAASYMRGHLAKSINLRCTPELTFVMDNSIEYGVHMSKLIDDVNRNLFKEDPASIDEEESDQDDADDDAEDDSEDDETDDSEDETDDEDDTDESEDETDDEDDTEDEDEDDDEDHNASGNHHRK